MRAERHRLDATAAFAAKIGTKIIHPAEDGVNFAPGYYSVLFEDPDGLSGSKPRGGGA